MPAEYENGNVRAVCPECNGAITTFEYREATREFGHLIRIKKHTFRGQTYVRTIYRLMRCAGCGRGGLATIHDDPNIVRPPVVSEFYPFSVDKAPLPPAVPRGIVAEYREAEHCASFGAYRAASALLRSALEKALTANGYTSGSLKERIDQAAKDGIITAPRQRRAHENVRVLGNDILHDEWRPVPAEEYTDAHQYLQRILEDFYDHRGDVEELLVRAGRLEKQ